MEGETTMEFPVPIEIELQESVCQTHSAIVPSVPPFKVRVVKSPSQITVSVTIISEGAVEFVATKISIEVHKNFKKLLKNKPGTIFGILGGSISDKQGRNVLTYGDIIRTNDLKTLSKVFKIKKSLGVVKVLKK